MSADLEGRLGKREVVVELEVVETDESSSCVGVEAE